MGEGTSVTLGDGDIAVIPKDATGTKTIKMTDDAAYVSIADGTSAQVDITLGSGENFIFNGGKNTTLDFTGAGKTKVALGDGSKAVFKNYDWRSGAGIAVAAGASSLGDLFTNLANKIESLLSAFTLKNSSGTASDILDDVVADIANDILDDVVADTASDILDDVVADTASDLDSKSAYVNLYYGSNYNDNIVMGMTGDGASYINTNETPELVDSSVVLVGNFTGEKGGTASLTSGGGNDAVFAGDGDTVDAGVGRNNIYLTNDNYATNGTSILMTSGINVIEGMSDNDVIITESAVNGVSASDGNLIISNENGGLTSIIGGANGENVYNVQANGVNYSAVVGSSKVVYNDSANYYNATGVNASITASSSSAEIWLNKDVAAQYGYGADINGDIKYINAAATSGRSTLAGAADIDNVITASKGASSLWGGGSSDDTLIGGSGSDTFFYMKGDGNDSIKGASEKDTIVLDGGLTLSDITKVDVTSSAIVLEFSDEGSLTLNTNSGTKFKIDGATYSYDKSSGEWKQS